MNLKELLQKRYSVRSYLPKEVEEEKLQYILQCGRLAPSAVNYQPWIFYVITSEDARKTIGEAYPREWFKTAPVYIIVCVDLSVSWKRSNHDNKNHADIDGSIAAQTICLATESLGLGTCWVCNYNPDILEKALDLPSHVKPVAIFPIGYIDEENSKMPEKKRKPITEITKWL